MEDLATFKRQQNKLLKEIDEEEKNATLAAVQQLKMSRECFRAERHYASLPVQKANLRQDTAAFVAVVICKLLGRESGGQRNDNVQADFKMGLCRYYDPVKPGGPPPHKNQRKTFNINTSDASSYSSISSTKK
jgi:ribosomal protein S14